MPGLVHTGRSEKSRSYDPGNANLGEINSPVRGSAPGIDGLSHRSQSRRSGCGR